MLDVPIQMRKGLIIAVVFIVVVVIGYFSIRAFYSPKHITPSSTNTKTSSINKWVPPDTNKLANDEYGQLIRYGRDLIVNTAYYYGPRGRIGQITNGLNCQNCHLNAGTKAFGSNFALVSTGYPRFKERSGSIETVNKKIEDCFERSLNGKQIDSNSREMRAMAAYLHWLGKDVKKGSHIDGAGIEELPFMNRPADVKTGEVVYIVKCKICHGADGQGRVSLSTSSYSFPPLWGTNSYNIGASMYRLSKLAGYVKNNMPLGVKQWQRISNEDAWDVAAFVNSKFHPLKDVSKDWPKLASKPYDYPFGPYADSLFSENQRKYGPFQPIKKYYASMNPKK